MYLNNVSLVFPRGCTGHYRHLFDEKSFCYGLSMWQVYRSFRLDQNGQKTLIKELFVLTEILLTQIFEYDGKKTPVSYQIHFLFIWLQS